MLQGSQSEEQKQNIYSRFYIAGRDIAAFFTDCDSDCQNCSLVVPTDNRQEIVSSTSKKVDDFYSLIDRCGMAVIVDQVFFCVIFLYILYNCHWYRSLILAVILHDVLVLIVLMHLLI